MFNCQTYTSWWIYLSRTAKSFCCSKACTNVIRKCLLLRSVEKSVMPSSMLGLVVLVACRQEGEWNCYFPVWFHLKCITHLLRPPQSISPPLVSSDPHFIFLSQLCLLFLQAPPSLVLSQQYLYLLLQSPLGADPRGVGGDLFNLAYLNKLFPNYHF